LRVVGRGLRAYMMQRLCKEEQQRDAGHRSVNHQGLA
jgi:hypothetical protein